jgi:hypothetical protein
MAKTRGKIVKLIPDESIIRKIYLFRGHKVMLDRDLAELYRVETKVLNQAVKRNIKRFPPDFMFRLTKKEAKVSRSQFVTLKQGQNIKYLPYVFAEQGIAMLSGIINSDIAIKMNIAIMRAFVELRKFITGNKKIAEQIKELLERVDGHDVHLNQIYDAIENLLDEKGEKKSWEERKRIGFKVTD